MKKLLLALAFSLAPSLAFAQCTGVFPPNTLCGNLTGSPAPPAAFTASGTIVGPGSSTLNGLPKWGNTSGTLLADAANTTIAGIYSWSGAQTFAPTSGTAITVTPASGTTAKGYDISQVGSTATIGADFSYNQIIVNDSLDTTGFYTFGSLAALQIGGVTAKGQKAAFRAIASLTGPSATAGDIIGSSNWCVTASNNGGTNTGAGAVGTCYGSEHVANLFSGATNYFVVSGGESDAIINAGASVKHRWGWSIVGNGSATGVVTDAALEIGGVTAAGIYNTGILLDNLHGFAPISTIGCVICTDGSANTITTGIDLSSYTMTTDWKFKGGTLLDTGAMALKLASTSKGATITVGAPGADNGGFVFGCGTNAGTAGLYIAAGTSTTATRVLDNIGGGVTGC